VSGLDGQVTKVTVTVTNLNHSAPGDINMLLVSPSGLKAILMAKAGGNTAIRNTTVTFDDAATAYVGKTQVLGGTYKPTSYALATPPFPVPAPPGPYTTNLATFNGSNPNGDWALYVFDDTQLDFGAISNGWALNLSVGGPVPAAADLGLTLSASTNIVVATSNILYSVTVTNYGPSGATNVVITDTLPRGGQYLWSNLTAGTVSTNTSGSLIWTVGNLAKDTGASLTFNVQASTAGLVTNTASVSAATRDPNPDDDSVSAIATVTAPAADLVLGLVGSPNPIQLGANLTYTIAVTNLGPATATGVNITTTLPAEAAFVSASPFGYTLVNRTLTFTNVGTLDSGGYVTATVVVKPVLAGTLNGTATTASTVVDPLKGNNTASVKTIVDSVVLSISRSGNNLVLSWSTSSSNLILESSPSLFPATWTAVTNPHPTDVGGVETITLPIGSDTQFFRLRAQ